MTARPRPVRPRGGLFVVSSPSGGGKTTVCAEVKKRLARVFVSVSMTTRAPRVGERQGRDYLFVSKEEFLRHKARHGFLEWARVLDNFYGTPKKPVLDRMRRGMDVILNIDIQGAMQVKKLYPRACLIFIMPPSLGELKKRLTHRSTEARAEIRKRLALAKKEITCSTLFDHVVVNEKLPNTINAVMRIIAARRRGARIRIRRNAQ
jgi:guanylate kinase